MTYIEMCYKIKELLFNITNNLNFYKYLVVYYNAQFMSGNLRGDIESISEEINEYLKDLINECEMEIVILNKFDQYITEVVLDFTPVFFEDSEEFHLFASIIKRINNSHMLRIKSTAYVFDTYNNLINTNGFNDRNYKILKRKQYISDDEYESYLNLSI